MNKQVQKLPRDYIVPLLINGMRGRMLRVPASSVTAKKKEILLVYGQHASLERIFGLAVELSEYGNVTCADLPGLGGMDSFYKVGIKPSLTNLSDYLASFIKLKYNHKRFTIIGLSSGFAVLTKTLQSYPELANKSSLAVNMMGVVHKDDYTLSKRTYFWLKQFARVGSARLPATILQYVTFFGPLMRYLYRKFLYKSRKLENIPKDERNRRIDFELHLWKINDMRTRLFCVGWLLRLDLCSVRVALPAAYVAPGDDKYINRVVVEQHMNVIYEKCTLHIADKEPYMPTIFTGDGIQGVLPKSIRNLLQKT